MIARELGIAVIELPYTEWLQALQIACSQSNDEQLRCSCRRYRKNLRFTKDPLFTKTRPPPPCG